MASKIWTLFAALILGLCFLLTILTVGSLRRTAKETDRLKAEVTELSHALDGYLAQEQRPPEEDKAELPTAGKVDPDTAGYVVRAVNNRVGVYTAEGALIRLLEILPAQLPAADREALSVGIALARWEDVLSLIADYTA